MKKHLTYIYTTFFFDPLAGGNGKIQTSEMAQWTLVIMICRASFKEGNGPEQVYPDVYWFCLFAAVCAIAGFKQVFAKPKKYSPPAPEL
jgi:hypothetical protein